MQEIENEAEVPAMEQEVASPQIEATAIDAEQASAEAEEKSNRAFAELRRNNRELAQKSKMQEELLQRMLSQQQQTPQAPVVQEEDIISQIAQEEYVPGEKVAKALKKQQEAFRKELDEVKKTYSNQKQNNLINDLKREFPDFDEVVNSETIAILDETNPRLANAIASSNDPYMIAVQTYEYIKAKGLASKPSKRASETERKLEQNKKTVNTPQSFEKRPMAQAFSMNQMSDAMKKELQKEMYGYAQHAGMGY